MIKTWWDNKLRAFTSTRRQQVILRNSYNEASLRGDFISDDEHLLLAMLKEPEGVASRV